jgi:hypothetical protein
MGQQGAQGVPGLAGYPGQKGQQGESGESVSHSMLKINITCSSCWRFVNF